MEGVLLFRLCDKPGLIWRVRARPPRLGDKGGWLCRGVDTVQALSCCGGALAEGEESKLPSLLHGLLLQLLILKKALEVARMAFLNCCKGVSRSEPSDIATRHTDGVDVYASFFTRPLHGKERGADEAVRSWVPRSSSASSTLRAKDIGVPLHGCKIVLLLPPLELLNLALLLLPRLLSPKQLLPRMLLPWLLLHLPSDSSGSPPFRWERPADLPALLFLALLLSWLSWKICTNWSKGMSQSYDMLVA
mmetsp:Transcript_8036/g.21407  ORF Transcript_8036/g.21407 Transcript_8036/m.21407 type:complete len:248 (+) Transcript_8036:2380-3123(+)